MGDSGVYRPDIDGLRALAVLSVVLCHFGAPGFGGGFVGVDVFFVISGYLIGGHIAEEIAAGRFSLVAFYERRIRRIAPGLFCTLALVMAAGAVILFGPDFRRLLVIAASVVEIQANVRLWQTLGAYAGAFAQRSALLHTWSLAVEEQFYLLFPLLMLAIGRFARRRYSLWLALLALVSFAACVVMARVDLARDFYLAPFRAWELLLGALVAVGPFRAPAGKLPGVLALLGLMSILAADLLLSVDTPFPSEYALLPCGGAALVLYARCSPRSLAGRFLENTPARRIGIWSYSLYLIHWPVLIFTRYYLDAPLPPGLLVALLAASLGLAALSWRFVEQPFRGLGGLFITVQIYALAAGASVLLLGAVFILRSGHIDFHKGAERDFPTLTQSQLLCWDRPADEAARLAACRLGSLAAPQAVLWGDSHARALIPAVAAAYAAHGASALAFAMGGCPPVFDVQMGQPTASRTLRALQDALDQRPRRCPEHNDAVLRWIASHRIKTAVLAAHWMAYAGADKDANLLANHLTILDPRRPEALAPASIFERNLGSTLAALRGLGVRVFIVQDAPRQDVDVPYALASDARLGWPARRGISRAAYDAQQAQVSSILERLHSRYAFTYLRPQDTLCAGGECVLSRGGEALYQDGEHLAPAGALAVVPAFEPLWR